MKLNFLKKKIIELMRMRSNFYNTISLRAFSYSIHNIRNRYRSKLLNINFSEYINVYKLKNVNLNIPIGIIQKVGVVIKNFKNPILSETIKNDFYANLIFTNRSKYLNKKSDLILDVKEDIYYFDIQGNKSNYYHFVNDNLVSLIFFLENYKSNFKILFKSDISRSINSFLYLISIIYKIKLIKFKNKNNILIKKNFIYSEHLKYSKEGFFYSNDKLKNKINNFTNESYSIYNFPLKFKKNSDRNYDIHNQYIANIVSNDQYNTIDKFIEKLIKLKKIKKGKKINYFIRRKKTKGFHNRILKDEEKIISFLKSKNFEIIYFDNMPIIKQIEHMLNSNIVIGIHGANLTNCIFKLKKTKLIELYPHNTNVNADFYKYIAEQRKLKYYRINCHQDINNELNLNVQSLKNLLKKII